MEDGPAEVRPWRVDRAGGARIVDGALDTDRVRAVARRGCRERRAFGSLYEGVARAD